MNALKDAALGKAFAVELTKLVTPSYTCWAMPGCWEATGVLSPKYQA